MKSPFLGMGPYIEAHDDWADFHGKLIAEIDRTLARLLPLGFRSRVQERCYVVLVDSDGKQTHTIYPDIGVGTRARPSALATEKVTMRPLSDENFKEPFIEVLEASPSRRLVTCIEVLSPSNKRPGTEGWTQYLRKRTSMFLGAANFVEIDLLQGGTRMSMTTPWPASP